jgi:hypothetical protein
VNSVTPVLATIILLAGTIVLSLVVGAYLFGLFGSSVKGTQFQSVALYGGQLPYFRYCTTSQAPYLVLSISDPGSTTNITSTTLTGSSLTVTANADYLGKNGIWNQVGTLTPNDGPIITAGSVTQISIYFNGPLCVLVNQLGLCLVIPPTGTIAIGQTFNYIVNFQNGQSISGVIIAQ